MTEKLRITREQAKEIEEIRDAEYAINIHSFKKRPDKAIAALSTAEIAKALYIGYEVDENFRVGDWVVRKDGRDFSNDRKAVEIKCIEPFNNYKNFKVWFLGGGYLNDDDVRHATPEEIKAEKERRVWKKIGREPGKFIRGDAGQHIIGSMHYAPGVIGKYYERGELKGFYPAESFIEFGGGE